MDVLLRVLAFTVVILAPGCGDDAAGVDGGAGDAGERDAGTTDAGPARDGAVPDGGGGFDAGGPPPVVTDCDMVPCLYVREGAVGTGDGSDWENAFPDLPASLARGSVYFLADGRYEGRVFDDPEDGARVITIVKAVEGDHGTDTGWDAGYGDGQATLGASAFYSGHYTIDGRRRNEDDWQQTESYGLRFYPTDGYGIHVDEEGSTGVTDLTFRHVDIGGDAGSVPPDTAGGVRLIGPHARLLFSRCHLHHGGPSIMSRGPDEVTVEQCHVGPDFSKEAIAHQDGDRWVIRHNHFVDNTAFIEAPGTEAGTAVIGVFDFSGGSDLDPDTVFSDDWQIYGNVFAGTGGYELINTTGGTIMAGNVHRWRVYNNTLSDLGGPWVGISLAGTDNIVRNTLIHRVGNYSDTEAALIACTATSCDHSWCFENNPLYTGTARVDADCAHLPGTRVLGTQDPFVDAAGLDYRLRPDGTGPSPVDTGIALGGGFDDRDGFGTVRGAGGAWDVGAYELPP